MTESMAFDSEDNIVSKLSKEQNEKLATSYSKKFRTSSEDIQNLIEDSKEGWDFYLNNQPNVKKMIANSSRLDSQSGSTSKGLRLGLIPKSVDAVLAIIHNAIFPSDERFFRGTPQNDLALRYQELYEQFRADNFAEDNTTEELRKFLLCLAIDPAACVSIHFKQHKRDKVSYEQPQISMMGMSIPVPMLPPNKVVKRDFIEWEGTRVECLDFNEWRVDPYAKRMEDSWFIRRWYQPVWEVEEQYGLKDVKCYHDCESDFNDPNSNQMKQSLGLTYPIPFEDEEEGKENALLMACYDTFIIGGKTYKNHVAIILNGSEVIWFGPNPYNHGRLPYLIHSLLPVPNSIYGLSLIKHAIPSAAVVDSATEKILKIGAIAADPIFEVDMMEPAFRKSRQVKCGMTIPVKRPGAIRQVPVNVANLSILENIITKAEDNVREVTGASPMFTGEDLGNIPTNTTAFTVGQHIQGANTRFQAIMNNFNNCILEPLLFMTFENDKQFKEKTEYVAVGDDTRELTPDMVKQMDFKWIITSAQAALARNQRLANLKSWITELLPMLVQSGVVQLAPQQLVADQFAALRDMLVLSGTPNANELLKSMPLPEGMPNGVPTVPQVNPAATGQPIVPAPEQPGVPVAPPPVPGPPAAGPEQGG